MIMLNRKFLLENGYTMCYSNDGDVLVEPINGDRSLHSDIAATIQRSCPDLHRDTISSITYDAVNNVARQQLIAKISKMTEMTMFETFQNCVNSDHPLNDEFETNKKNY